MQSGWAIQITRCRHLDPAGAGSAEIYAVNLVMPWARDNGISSLDPTSGVDEGKGRGPAISGMDASKDKRMDRLLPWRWQSVMWKVYWGGSESGPWTAVNGTLALSTGTDLPAALTAASLEKEFFGSSSKTGDCPYAFSASAADLDIPAEKERASKRSFPHVLAPLTHWPAGASNGDLKLAGFLELDPAVAANLSANGATHLVCFPEFTYDHSGQKVNSVLDENKRAIAAYDNDPELTMICQPVLRNDPDPANAYPLTTSVELSQGGASEHLLRSLAARELAPTALLWRSVTAAITTEDKMVAAHYFEQFRDDVALRRKWIDALLQFCGKGWLPFRVRGNNRWQPHLTEQLIEPADAVLLAPALTNLAPGIVISDAMLTAALATLSARATDSTWVQADREFWVATGNHWERLISAAKEEANVRLESWLEVARALSEPLRLRQFFGHWIVAVFDAGLQSLALKDRWNDRLKSFVLSATVSADAVDSTIFAVLEEKIANVGALIKECVGFNAPPDPKPLIAALEMAVTDPLKFVPAAAAKALGISAEALEIAWKDVVIPGRARPRDQGITMKFESNVPGGMFDQQVRGYAIGLCSYLPSRTNGEWVGDNARAQWITDTAIWDIQKRNWLQENGQTVWMHETVGSTLHDGFRVASVDYHGNPSATLLANEDGTIADRHDVESDADGADAIDFRWQGAGNNKKGRTLPLLGYGMYYSAVASVIDNAGGILDTQFRTKNVADLKPANEIFITVYAANTPKPSTPPAPEFQYRSAVPAGAPVVVDAPPDSAYELSEETKAHAYEVHRRRVLALDPASGPEPLPVPKIALLAHDQQIVLASGENVPLFSPSSGASSAYEIRVEAPSASAEFIERWLNTDIVLKEHLERKKGPGKDIAVAGSLSDSNFEATTADMLRTFRDDVIDGVKKGIKQGSKAASPHSRPPGFNYNPAVSAIGVAIWTDGAEMAEFVHAFPVARTTVDAKGVLGIAKNQVVTIKVEVASEGEKTKLKADTNAVGQQVVNLQIARGSFVRVRTFSLIDRDHFDQAQGCSCRYYSDLQLASAPLVPEFKLPKPSAAFGPTEHWFEAMPSWVSKLPQEVALTIVPPGGKLAVGEPLSPTLLALQATMKMEATWIRGLYVQRHEWHWTGYPVRLPMPGSEDKIESWLASFSGVESYREAFDVNLTTSFDHLTWRYGIDAKVKNVDVIFRKTLQTGARPARYAAFTARPIVRFRRWLNPKVSTGGALDLERRVYASGAHIPGVAPGNPNDRLPPPPLRWAIPLTATYSMRPQTQSDSELQRAANGNLLVFDDALRRTDQLSRLGGVGDTLEIDLLETRDNAYDEIGVNPIFHANQPADEARISIVTHEPFGLTHDISSNALVAQTGVVVSTEGAAGRWTLAKVRTRRVVLPETMVGSELVADQASDGNLLQFSLRARREGDDDVPLDFCLDIDVPTNAKDITVSVVLPNGGKKLPVKWPDLSLSDLDKFDGQGARFLCSWHKQRWLDDGAKDPAWRLQVLAQARKEKTLAWQTIKKSSGFNNAASELPQGARFESVKLEVTDSRQKKTPFTLQSVRLSDYTDPIWLTFIGSFGREQLRRADEYQLVGSPSSLVLHGPEDGLLPVLNSLSGDDPRFQILLVYKPLADITRGDDRHDTGILVAAFCASGETTFVALETTFASVATLEGCYGYLCSVQRITAKSDTETPLLQTLAQDDHGKPNFDVLLSLMFPSATTPDFTKESTLRLLPEYVGPIAVVAS